MKRFFLSCVFLCCGLAFSQINTIEQPTDSLPDQQTTWEKIKYDGVSAFKGITHVYSRPFHWEGDDWLTAGAIIAGEALFYSVDTDLDTYFGNQGKDIPQGIKDFGWYLGKPQYNYLIIGGIYAGGLLTKNEKVRRTGVLMISSATATGVFQTVIKTVVGRARPGAGLGKHDFEMFSSKASHHSFPSGHAMLSMTLAHSLAKQFDNIWLKAGIYAVGSITPLSRMWDRAHWATDVVFGTVISILTVDSIDNYLNKANRYPEATKNKISWRFKAGYNTFGVVGTF
ncbi:phosphatase PAP2 family protein [Mangrovimonas spongiae]|uniref:Phosphatase PAP2 family protein n=1 Tax=Mangrovimonas spongiae TaxID=2494697 RepID=A0A428K1B1_9FLAO|nr:phosphatase PAP2 family protein [Mangrovimonas spongiae]RSK40232.1 phosphatase PAP2 family protein [Mangrovimonas spongiae]